MTDFERMNFKITYIKAGSLLISSCIVAFTFGHYMTDWQEWRKTTTEKVSVIEQWKEKVQTAMNGRRAEYNRSINTNQ